MTLGKINFADLNLLLWDSAEHFLPMQDYLKAYDQAIYQSIHAVGIISGCALVPVSGLTVKVEAGVVLFSNGELCSVVEQEIVLGAADPTDARIDRIEMAFTFENNVQVTKTDDSTAQLDKVATATVSANAGTPDPSPAIPALTAGNLSAGTVTIPATATVVGSSDINQGDDVRSLSSKINNEREFSVPVSTSGAENITGLLADKNQYKQVWFDYFLSRKTDDVSSGKVISGTFSCMLNPETGDWLGSDSPVGNTEEIGVELSVVPASGQMQWIVDGSDFGGANHLGVFTVIRRTLDV